MKTDVIKTGVIQVADLNPFHAPIAPSVYKPFDKKLAADLSEKIMPTVEESALEEPVLPIINEVDTTLVDANNPIEENIDLNNNYHIIAGCFQEGENAFEALPLFKNQQKKFDFIYNNQLNNN